MLTKKPYVIEAGPKRLDAHPVKLTIYADPWMFEIIEQHEAVITTPCVTPMGLIIKFYGVDPRYDAQEVVADLCKQLDLAIMVEEIE